MRLKQRVERYYAVWRYDDVIECWYEYIGPFTGKRKAIESLRQCIDEGWANERYCLVATVNRRI